MQLCGIIKPHALPCTREILALLEAKHAFILEMKSVRYTNELVEILYDHMSADARTSIAEQLVGLDGMALLLSVPSIEWFLRVVGRESDPTLCSPNSIRARFGAHAEPALVGGEVWWDNAFHRPIDEREAARDLLYLFNIASENSD